MASVDSGVETSNDSNDSSATPEQQSNGSAASKSKELILYPKMPNILTSFTFDDSIPDVSRYIGAQKTLHIKFPVVHPVFPSISRCQELPLSTSGEQLFNKNISARSEDFQSRKAPRRRRFDNQRRERLMMFGGLYERRLRVAVMSNNIEVVQNLLWTGTNPNCSDSHMRTPLHLAACRGYADIVRLLLENNADPNRRDLLGNTPLHLAACTNNVVVVTLLLRAGTDVKSTDDFGRNPLQIAESKLKLLQKLSSSDVSAQIKGQVYQIIEMLREFLNRTGQDCEAELINSFSSRLTLSKTRDQVESQVRDLLASLPHLTLNEKESSNDSSASSSASVGGASAGSPVSVSAIDLPNTSFAPKMKVSNNSSFSVRSVWGNPCIFGGICSCNLETCPSPKCRNMAKLLGYKSSTMSSME